MALQIRRGTDAERQVIIPLQGELIFTTDTKRLYVGDGTTLGGVAVDTAGAGGGASVLNDLTDVTISGLSTGQVLKWNGTAWINGTDNTGTTISSINDIADVTLTSPTAGQVLKYNGTAWVNGTDLNDGTGSLSLNDLTNVNITSIELGQVLKWNGTAWVNETDLTGESSILELNDVPDVIVDDPELNQVLTWNGFNWVNGDIVLPSMSLTDLTDVNIPIAPEENQILSWNGVSWVATDNSSITSLSEDLNPALGGNLNLNTFNITGIGDINIEGNLSCNGIATDLFYFELTHTELNPSNGTILLRNIDNAIAHTEVNALTEGPYGTGITVKVARDSLDTPSVVLPGDSLHQEVILGYDGSNYNYTSAIIHFVDPFSTISTGSVPGSIGLVTWTDDAGDLTKSLIIDSRGYVSIGKGLSQAEATLDINGFAKLAILTAAPTSPANGMVAIADGTNWNPLGNGVQSMVAYLGGAWRAMAVAS